MTILDVSADIEIERKPDVVRRQFADVAHHERTGVHRGVRFGVIDDDGRRCRYRQLSRLGPVTLEQKLLLVRTDAGPLVNTVVAGQFSGGTISFEIQPAPDHRDHALVGARLVAEVNGARALFAPILRRSVAKALRRALEEDKLDLEEGGYDRSSTRATAI